MALPIFPPSPTDGQIFPNPAPVGQNVYRWSSAEQTWRLLGWATGVIGGTYGSSTQIPRFTVNDVGTIEFAENVSISLASILSTGVVQIGSNINVDPAGVISVNDASLTQKGVVQLVNTTSGDCDFRKALTAAAGCLLQAQIDSLQAQIDAIVSSLGNLGIYALDNIASTFDGLQTVFNLTISGAPFQAIPSSNVIIILNGVTQLNGSSYVLSGSQITFAVAPTAGTSFIGLTVLAP